MEATLTKRHEHHVDLYCGHSRIVLDYECHPDILYSATQCHECPPDPRTQLGNSPPRSTVVECCTFERIVRRA